MIKFYLYVLYEYILYLLFRIDLTKRNKRSLKTVRDDSKISLDKVIYHVHEWAGYPFVRQKLIKYRNISFSCGLRFSLERLKIYNGKYKLNKILTISDNREIYMKDLKRQGFFQDDIDIVSVDNYAMDFSGYSMVTRRLVLDDVDYCVFFSNTSVNAKLVEFIDDYVQVYLQNKNIGLLGISYSSKIYQTLIKDNFSPHIQSFFFLTSSNVLRKVMDNNGQIFPGEKEKYKLSLIRFGEAKLSRIVQDLGLDIAIINGNGELQILPQSKNDTEKNEIVDGDYRLYVQEPNTINKYKFI